MGEVLLGINLESVRHDKKPLEWAVEKATDLLVPTFTPIFTREF